MNRRPRGSTLFPYTTLFRSRGVVDFDDGAGFAQGGLLGDLLHRENRPARDVVLVEDFHGLELGLGHGPLLDARDRKSTRLNSSHLGISYAVFCLKKKKTYTE